MDVVDAVLSIGLNDKPITLSALVDGWTLSPEVTVKESVDCIVKELALCAIAGEFVTKVDVVCTSVFVDIMILWVIFVAVDGRVVVSMLFVSTLEESIVMGVIVSIDIVVTTGVLLLIIVSISGEIIPIVVIESSVVFEFFMLTVTFASWSMLDRSKP